MDATSRMNKLWTIFHLPGLHCTWVKQKRNTHIYGEREYVKIWSETSYCEKSFQTMNICCPFNISFLQELTIYILLRALEENINWDLSQIFLKYGFQATHLLFAKFLFPIIPQEQLLNHSINPRSWLQWKNDTVYHNIHPTHSLKSN